MSSFMDPSSFFWSPSLLSSFEILQTHIFSTPAMESITSPMGPGSFHWRMMFRTQDLDASCAHHSQGIVASRPSQKTKLEHILTHVYTHICIYLCLSIWAYMLKAWIHTSTFNSNPKSQDHSVCLLSFLIFNFFFWQWKT